MMPRRAARDSKSVAVSAIPLLGRHLSLIEVDVDGPGLVQLMLVMLPVECHLLSHGGQLELDDGCA